MSLGLESISKSYYLPASFSELLRRERKVVHALVDVNLEVDEGEFFVILGPTGCGKTTLLNVVAGLVKQDRGHVFIDGECVDHYPPEKRNVSMVFQDFALFPHMTVYENIAYGLEARGVKGVKATRRVKEVIKELGLEGLEDRKPHSLSGGEKQRVSLARALVVEPRIILLDEPLSNLDVQTRSEARKLLLKTHKNAGITMLYVTHDQLDAYILADRVAIMRSGTIEQVGSIKEIVEAPKSSFVASFMRLGNVFSGVVEKHDEKNGVTVVSVEGFSFSIPYSPSLLRGAQVNFLVKPEDVIIARTKPDTSARNVLKATIIEASPQGPLVRVLASSGEIQVEALATRASADELGIKEGEEVYLVFKASSIHVLE